MTTLDQLEALADAATHGPWHHDILKSLGPTVRAEVTALGKTVAKTYPTGSYIQDAAFIAAANPQTVKQLIALVRQQHEALWTYSWKAEHKRTKEDECLAKEALAAFDAFNGRE